MRRLSALLAAPNEPQDTIPAFSQDRSTVVLDREPTGAESDAGYQEWRRQQYAGDADDAARRMIRKERQ